MKGIQYLTDEDGVKRAVVIDIKRHGKLWEDIYDSLLASERENEPRESLQAVKRKLQIGRNSPG